MLRFAADENFNGDIVRGLLRRNPGLDIIRIQDTVLYGALISSAGVGSQGAKEAKERRIVLTRGILQVVKVPDIDRQSLKSYQYTVLFEPAEEGGYVVHVPALPGLWTQGETLAEAREMAREAIAGYIEALLKAGDPVPPDSSRDRIHSEILEVAVPA